MHPPQKNRHSVSNSPRPSLPTPLSGFKLTNIETRFNSIGGQLPAVHYIDKLRYSASDKLHSIRSSRNGIHKTTRLFRYAQDAPRITIVEDQNPTSKQKRGFQLEYNSSGQVVQAAERNPGERQKSCQSYGKYFNGQRVEFQYENGKLRRVLHHWSPFDDDAQLEYDSSNQLSYFQLQYGSFDMQWSQEKLKRVTSTDSNWECDFRFDYSHDRVQRIHSPGMAYTIYYNRQNLISRIVLLDEIYDRHVVTLYSYKKGKTLGIQPFPAFEHGRFFDFKGQPVPYFPILSLKEIFGI